MAKKRNNDGDVVLSKETPLKSAEIFKSLRHPTLINYQNEWLSWDGGAYQAIEADTITAIIRQFLGDAKITSYKMVPDKANSEKKVQVEEEYPFNPKETHVKEVNAALKSICHVPRGAMDPPTWLKDTPAEYAGLDPNNLISFQNGLLEVTTRTLYPATPFFFTRTALPINFDSNATAPTQWLAFLDDVLKARPELIGLVQEMLGYLITTDTSKQKVFMLWGRPRSGKGTILRITTALCGQRNVRFPTIKTLAGRFGLQGLIEASVAQVTDMDTENTTELSTAVSRINGVSGEDGQQIERKGIGDWEGVLDTRFVLASNTLPKLGSHTEAMLTRLLVVPFEVSVVGREDRDLTKRLIDEELPGIMNWALDGLDRLRQRGDFAEPEESRDAKRRVKFLSNPLHGFVEEHCEMCGPDEGADKNPVYAMFERYCTEINAKVMTKGDFTEELQKVFPNVRAGKRRRTPTERDQREREHTYFGIRLNEATAHRVYEVEDDGIGLGLIEVKLDPNGWPIPRPHGPSSALDDFAA
jgi:putative DNA primase/helicase